MEKAKMVHLAHVLGFPWVHYTAVERQPAGEGGRKEEGRMQYLVTMELVDPGPMLPTEQYAGMMRQVVLPGHEALKTLKSEGKILAGGFLLERGL
jgi:hypothetical protein